MTNRNEPGYTGSAAASGMKAMIMAAGLGSRLMPLTSELPKPMFPVMNKPLLEHIVTKCRNSGIRDVMINLFHLPEKIESHFGSGKDHGVNISYSLEKKLMGTAGSVKRVSSFFKDTFFVLSGDVYTDIDLDKMLEFHRSTGSKFTLAVKKFNDVSKFGVVDFDAAGVIKGFQEKPKNHEAVSNYINLGIYIIEPELLELIPRNTEFDFAKELFPLLLEKKIPFRAFKTTAYWNDIGSIEEYYNMNFDLLQAQKNKEAVMIGSNCTIGRNVVFKGGSMIGNNVKIGKGTVLNKSIIFNNTFIGRNVHLENCIVSGEILVSRNNLTGFNLNDPEVAGKVENISLSAKLSEMAIKMTDKTISFISLLLLSPLFLVLAAIIKLDSSGPVFYVSTRLQSPEIELKGSNWRLFYAHKPVKYYVFRTMFTDADKSLSRLENKYDTGPFVKIKDDPRVTRAGKILRKTSLDELPLLINVLKGEMSLVGIWALPAYEANSIHSNGLISGSGDSEIDLSELARIRFQGKPGLAGIWQSSGRSNLSAEERAMHDSFQTILFENKYELDNRNLYMKYLDMIFRTFKSVVSREGAM